MTTPLKFESDGWEVPPTHDGIADHPMPVVTTENTSGLCVDFTLRRQLSFDETRVFQHDLLERGALHACASLGDVDGLRIGLSTEFRDANAIDKSGWTPMHDAVVGDKVDCVMVLLHHGASLETRTPVSRVEIQRNASQALCERSVCVSQNQRPFFAARP
jgi:ankyrin repeat protein